jgi:chaperonin GroES
MDEKKMKRYPQPLGSRVLVKRDAAKAVTEGGLIIPDEAQQKMHMGVVLAVGPDVKTLKVDDHVIFENYAATELELDKEPVLVLYDEDVMIVLQEDN